MLILGIESSCDETGVALVDAAGPTLLAHAVHSQVDMHDVYGGVVPELASRDHIRRLVPLQREVLARSGRSISEVRALGCTDGPGLAGALLVGMAYARGLGLAIGVPVLGIHHLEGHLLSPLLAEPAPAFPFLALLVSGGHTQLVRVEGVGRYRILGETRDDAAGEAFDKTAKLLGLGYPGGASLSRLAESGRSGRYRLPRPMIDDPRLEFSFSGLKTAVSMLVRRESVTESDRADVARAFEEAIVEVLVAKSVAAIAATGLRRLVVSGGVGANRPLRAALASAGEAHGFQVFHPPLEYCTDNAAMIAYAAALRFREGIPGSIDGAFSAKPRWPLEAVAVSG